MVGRALRSFAEGSLPPSLVISNHPPLTSLMLTFRDYMESVLYDPQNGYYGATRQVMADFVTAPEVHGSFGAVLADDFAARFEAMERRGLGGPWRLVEMGPGDGRLAAVILRRLRDRHPSIYDRIGYVLVERSARFLRASLETLKEFSARIEGCEGLDALPPVTGIFFSNELVDAFPVHLLEKREGKVYEVYVTRAPIGDGIRVELGACSRPELEPSARAMAGILEEGQRHAVNLEARAWIRSVAKKLRSGTVVTIDYGKRYPADSVTTPRVFYRHRLEDFPSRPGREDVTASVDFEALIREGEAAGLATESYTTMARFLLDRGILDHLPEGDALEAQRERSRIKTLFHPDGMGERYKVLVQAKEVIHHPQPFA
jgi:SAM-dependent MidA family methyltransferase